MLPKTHQECTPFIKKNFLKIRPAVPKIKGNIVHPPTQTNNENFINSKIRLYIIIY